MARKCIEPAIVCCSLGCSLMGPIIDCFDLSGSGGGLVPLGGSIYKEAEAVLYFCIDFFSQAIKLNTSNLVPQLLVCNLKLPPRNNSTGKPVRPKLLLQLYDMKFGSMCPCVKM